MNAIGTQLRDPINSGLTQWRIWRFYKWTPPRNSGGIPKVSTRFSLSMEMSRLTRDGTAEPVSREKILRHTRGQENIHFPCSADHEQDWQLTRLIHTLLCVMTIHTYICRKERAGSVAANSDNLGSYKEAGGGAQGAQGSGKICTSTESVSPLSRLIRGFRNKYH